jgi:hypothetical protein
MPLIFLMIDSPNLLSLFFLFYFTWAYDWAEVCDNRKGERMHSRDRAASNGIEIGLIQ